MKFGRYLLALLLGGTATSAAFAHGITGEDQAFLLNNVGPQIGPYIYLGAKHMVTGYDHLAFLAGVIFFLHRLRDVVTYVTLFAVGHSATLLLGVLGGVHANPFLIDAVIGFSVVYKAFENLDGFRHFGFQPNMKAAVLIFGVLYVVSRVGSLPASGTAKVPFCAFTGTPDRLSFA